MLSEAEVARYHRDGYVVPDFRLPADELMAIRATHDRLLVARPEFRDYCPAVLEHDLGFLNFARNPDILDMVERVLGPDLALWNSSFFAKPARNGRRTPWHQDSRYWPIRPMATCTVWIAVDDSTPENGCLRAVRGSHKAGRSLRHQTNESPDLTLSQELLPGEFDEAQARDIVLEAGQVSLHDVFLVHGSEPNRSPEARRGMTLRIMPTTSVFDRELAARRHREIGLADHSRRTLVLMRGRDRSGRNDFLIRH